MVHTWARWAAGLALAAALSAAQAQDTLKLSHSFPASHPLHAAVSDWAESIARESNGAIAVQVHPDQQLGKAFDQYDLARTGGADIAVAVPGLQIGRFPLFAAGELPLLFANAGGGSAALDAWYRGYAAQDMPDVKFCLAFVHDPGTVHSVKAKVAAPADLDGLKIRPAQNTLAEWVRMLDGSPVRAAESELRDLMVRGVVQAAMLPWQSAIAAGTDQIARNHLDLPLYTTPFALALNKQRYVQMPEGRRGVIDRHCDTGWAERLAAPWAAWERAGRDTMRTMKGHEFTLPAPAQIDQWRAAVAPLAATWASRVKRVGGDPDAALEGLKAELARRNAAF